jgi:hypothetical protein
MATKGLPPIPTGEVHSEQRAIIIQRPGWKAAPISTEAAEHDAQKGHVNTLSNGPTPKYAIASSMCHHVFSQLSLQYRPFARRSAHAAPQFPC